MARAALNVSAIVYILSAIAVGLALAGGRASFVSPGDELAFMSNQDGDWDIYTLDVGRGLAHALTDFPYDERYPRWSPDGARIAYHADPRVAFDIYLMDDRGVNPTIAPASADAPAAISEGMIAWAPDGEAMVFQRGAGSQTNFALFTGAGDPLIAQDGRDLVYADWSPDGGAILYTVIDPDSRYSLATLDLASGRVRSFRGADHNDFYGVFSPDGAAIVFVSDRDGSHDIFLMNRDGSGVRNLSRSRAFDIEPAWTSAGDRVIFSSNRDGGYDLYAVSLTSGVIERVTSMPGDERGADWRPQRHD